MRLQHFLLRTYLLLDLPNNKNSAKDGDTTLLPIMKPSTPPSLSPPPLPQSTVFPSVATFSTLSALLDPKDLSSTCAPINLIVEIEALSCK